jgi:DNA-directed RNA polymerase subunit RPC12/RpoP
MKELSREEFHDRVMAINRARKIFGELTDKNITNAFIAYQEVFAEREREIFISDATNPFADKIRNEINKYERPECPDCGSKMFFTIAPENDDGIKTMLICSNKECDTRLDSELSLEDWMKVLVKK